MIRTNERNPKPRLAAIVVASALLLAAGTAQAEIHIDFVSPSVLVRGHETVVMLGGQDVFVDGGPSTITISGGTAVAVTLSPELLQFTTVAIQLNVLGTLTLTLTRHDGVQGTTTVEVVEAATGPVADFLGQAVAVTGGVAADARVTLGEFLTLSFNDFTAVDILRADLRIAMDVLAAEGNAEIEDALNLVSELGPSVANVRAANAIARGAEGQIESNTRAARTAFDIITAGLRDGYELELLHDTLAVANAIGTAAQGALVGYHTAASGTLSLDRGGSRGLRREMDALAEAGVAEIDRLISSTGTLDQRTSTAVGTGMKHLIDEITRSITTAVSKRRAFTG